MKLAALVGLVFFGLFIVVVIGIPLLLSRRMPVPKHRLRLRGTIVLVAVVFAVQRWLQSMPWLPRHP
jgi:uncharacterized membrane protein YvlD (DUF360 family)